ncbi:UDP-glucose 4-epimerase [Pelagirhabdus alkalitolerans]|uniref:UDP-glucose 4-epimerase n=1 Tax=Pelagirhabdus alkalitolerans TaxID=1612202 RepID=A0A1G6GGF2_9BACI|nr:NAD-dependent epimerase/dehydratase family protein [Pelagirhabdus alkalitolerans]SDB81102.1 UDP-glucose 4-epimerase [Pelagirhabdus alkalitolerans]
MKRILITGENSYIGNKFEEWLEPYGDAYQVDTISVRGEDWKSVDFSTYDVVFHVAGIAHVSTDPKMEELYYQVNRDLTIDVAKKAKKEGVAQFIFMSSIIVYGDGSSDLDVITRDTEPNPSNFYGESKLQAERGIEPLSDDQFKVAIIRPPMIYGKGSKGNYPKLSKLARLTPVFPNIENQRSMLHVDNLTEFLRLVIDKQDNGLFFPQNKEYVKTSELVKQISKVHGKKVWLTRLFNPLIYLFINRVNTVNKVFGNLVYDKHLSQYKGSYNMVDLYRSLERTESRQKYGEDDTNISKP